MYLINFYFQTDSNSEKLPTLYLMDSIIKNHGDPYKLLFSNNISDTFASVYSVSDKTSREMLLEVRKHWTNILPLQKLYDLDKKIYEEYENTWPFFQNIVEKPQTKRGRGRPCLTKQGHSDIPTPKYFGKLKNVNVIIHNVACIFETRCKLDLDHISENAWNLDYIPGSGKLQMRQKTPYYSLAKYGFT